MEKFRQKYLRPIDRVIIKVIGSIFIFLYRFITGKWGEDANIPIIRRYARRNRYKFAKQKKGAVITPPLISMRLGEQSTSWKFSGDFDGLDFEAFNFVTTVEIKGIPLSLETWVAKFTLGPLPSFVIDPKNFHDIPMRFSDYKKLNLGGNFSKKINIYVPKGSHIDVMSVIAPDEMAILLDHGKETDMVVDGKHVWLMIGKYNRQAEEYLKKLFDVAAKFLPELKHRTKTYKN